MQNDNLLIAFRNDVEFAGWQDTLSCEVNRVHKRGHHTILAELRVNGHLKIQLLETYGLHIYFMQGNKIIEDHYIINVINDSEFENKICDYFEVSFATGREIYRSLMSIAVKNFRV